MAGKPVKAGRRAAGQPLSAADDLDAALADRQAARFSIGQASELLGVAPWFLRRLDALDVVKPARSEGAQRRYSREQLGQAADAKALMDDGVSVSGVRRVLELQARVRQLEAELDKAKARLHRKSNEPRPHST